MSEQGGKIGRRYIDEINIWWGYEEAKGGEARERKIMCCLDTFLAC
jgi:hypothetical protein